MWSLWMLTTNWWCSMLLSFWHNYIHVVFEFFYPYPYYITILFDIFWIMNCELQSNITIPWWIANCELQSYRMAFWIMWWGVGELWTVNCELLSSFTLNNELRTANCSLTLLLKNKLRTANCSLTFCRLKWLPEERQS